MPVAWATLRRTWTMTSRAYPWSYAVGCLLIGVFTIGLSYLGLHAIGGGSVAEDFTARTGGADYLGYIAIGAAGYMFTVRMLLWSSKALITEQRQGTLGALLIAPAGRLPYLLGFTGFALLNTAVEVGLLGGFAAVLGVTLPAPHPLAALAGVVALAAAVFAVAVVLGALMIVAGEAHISQNTVFLAVSLLCGITFPNSYLPAPAQWLAELLPVTSAMDVLRDALGQGRPLTDLLPRLVTCLALSAGYLLLGLRLLPAAERRAIERSF
ncbi:ABC transporter permease [Kitasatospora sp. NPDC050467]|uniref:ABC transporter permease n=1 Tax=Kitasatospora sp. NPDC050467 TaxID=3364053 RepID=UPI0037B96129